MKKIKSLFFLCLCCCLCLYVNTPDAVAGSLHNGLSLQGYTGILNTPTAAVTEEGKIYLFYSNQKENGLRSKLPREDSYMISAGLFSFLEFGGRLTDAPPRIPPDLSANIKVRVPYFTDESYFPQFAFGWQDAGGSKRFFNSRYVVASKTWWRLRLSAGYGFGPERMNGVFGGVEAKAADWLYLLAEHDTLETNLGVRLITPNLFGFPVNLNVTAKTSLDYHPGSFEIGAGLQIPLGPDYQNRTVLPVEGKLTFGHVVPEAGSLEGTGLAGAGLQTEGISEPADGRPRSLAVLRDRLATLGLENVAVGEGLDGILVVEYENNRFKHNELDGLGVVAGCVAESAPAEMTRVILIVKKEGIRVLELEMPLPELKEFLRNPSGEDNLAERLIIRPYNAKNRTAVSFLRTENRSWPKLSIMTYPGLITYVGTEVGAFDYLLSLKLDGYLHLWPGGVLNSRVDIPVSWSENFEEGKSFRASRHESRMDRLMVFQAVKLAPSLMANLGIGMLYPEVTGTMNELLWVSPSGAHSAGVRQAHGRDGELDLSQELYLGYYRYYWDRFNLFFTGTGGKFWSRDTGVSVEMKRFFSDTAVSLFYKNTKLPDGSRIEKGGIQFSFPLTPRREMRPAPVHIRGAEEWTYVQETEIASPGQRNRIDRPAGINPMFGYNLDRVFQNRGRLNDRYIRSHLLRMRDAYITYVYDQRKD